MHIPWKSGTDAQMASVPAITDFTWRSQTGTSVRAQNCTIWLRRELPLSNGYYAYDALMVNDQEMYEILCEMKNIGGILGVHYENGPVLNCLREKALGCRTYQPGMAFKNSAEHRRRRGNRALSAHCRICTSTCMGRAFINRRWLERDPYGA